MTRKGFLTSVGAFLCLPEVIASNREAPLVRFGLFTDIHWPYFAASQARLQDAVAFLKARNVDFIAELGDLKDNRDGSSRSTAANAKADLVTLEGILLGFGGPVYHVLGNHDTDKLTKAEVFERIYNGSDKTNHPTSGYYSYDVNGVHFIVLDACFGSKGEDYSKGNISWTNANIPAVEEEWLRADLAAASGPVIVFCHQRFDSAAGSDYRVKRAATFRELFSSSGKVKVVFTGHQHVGGQSNEGGVFYCSIPAMRNSTANSFAEAAVYASGEVSINRFLKTPPQA